MTLDDRKIIFLTGAPRPSALEWGDDILSDALLPCFTNPCPDQVGETPEILAPSWRSLPLTRTHWPTGLTQASRPEWTGPGENPGTETSILNATELTVSSTETNGSGSQAQSSSYKAEDVTSQYYEHSFAVHDVPASQILGPASTGSPLADDSFESAMGHDPDPGRVLVRFKLCSADLTKLMEMPNAPYLRSITPQTMTVNLVVGIISISRPRTLITRKAQRAVELVEMLVGDDSRAGFGINVWLSSSSAYDSGRSNISRSTEDILRIQTLRLRPQDIILARNIALGTFQGRVYGQSLRRGMTTLDLLSRNALDADDERGAYSARDLKQANDPLVCKVKHVKDWVIQFVGSKGGADAGAKASTAAQLSSLPLDTQSH